jgi:hypothetical protein
VVILLLLAMGILLSLPYTQTKLGIYTTNWLNKTYGCDINVERVDISVFGGVKLKKVLIKDHHKDTLIYANRIKTNILDIKKWVDVDLIFGDVRIDGLYFNLKQYKAEKENNIVYFSDLFSTGKPSKKKFLLTANNVYITNGRFEVVNENHQNPNDLILTKLDISTSNLKILGPDVTTKINKMSFKDSRGIFVENLSTLFTYTPKNIICDNFDLKTRYSSLKAAIRLDYDNKGFSDFVNKVVFDAKIKEASLSSNDIRYYYKELGKNQIFDLNGRVKGSINNLFCKDLHLKNENKSHIIGDILFKNLVPGKNQSFYMKGDFDKINSNYENLTTLLPNILGKKLPSSLQKLGQFNINGTAEITTSTIDTDIFMTTALGDIKTSLVMTNIDNIDNANYSGNLDFKNFYIGQLLGRKDVEKITLQVDIDGKGFTQKYLNTRASGIISNVKYNNYTYTNIKLDGYFKSPIFDGKVNINDPNLLMDFDGLVDFSKKEKRYDFRTKIDYANLKRLGFVKDSIAIFRGDVSMDVTGNTVDDLQGVVNIAQTSYQNKKDNYIFDDFTLTSYFDRNRVRTITINSPDIIEGEVVGKFQFNQVQKMIENAAGSLYANYSPNKIKKGQFLNFNFSVYNKILEIFYPGIELGSNTNLSGKINSDQDQFVLNFTSPNIKAFENHFDNINVSLDNKNPLYNAYIEMDSIKTKQYKISNFSLINITANDTLFVRTEFKGGQKADDFYNINLYHTIDEDRNSVIGIQKSEVSFKDYLWYLNEKEQDNKVIFDKKLKNFSIKNIVLSHEDQQVNLSGIIKGINYKDLELNFENVNLSKILPTIPRFEIAGKLNGKVNLKQENSIYQPTTSLVADDLAINKILLGKLSLDIEGDNSFKKFKVNSSIENENLESFLAQGNLTIENKQTNLDLDLRFDKFNLETLKPLGQDVISNIRGYASGSTYITGTIDKPNINGRLYLNNAGLKIPYLNVDYELQKDAIVDLSDSQFIFQNITLQDNKYGTEGKINGSINHKKFSDWALDLLVSTDRLLVLDTPDSEESLYYGKAFINGSATIFGPTDGLLIAVEGKSSKDTEIKIPVNTSESVGNKGFIHFLSKVEKDNIQKGITQKLKNYNGLELKFNLDINPDAEIEVILDRATGHALKGRGNGLLYMEINTLGKFKMTGDFVVDKGIYNFKYKGLFDKKFDIKPKSSISWDGDPLKARLNIDAIYNTQANPSILTNNTATNKKIGVDLVIGITGNLSQPEPDFNFNFKNVNTVLQSEIQAKLNDKDIRQTQALSLLATGSFVSNEGLNLSAATDNLYEAAGGIFDKLFENSADKVKFDLSVRSVDRTPGRETDGQFGVNISTQINDRITVNGNLGIPVGGINQSAVVGNLEVQYSVNEDRTLNLRFFNRENEIRFIGQGIGYTQGGGINYEVDFNTFRELYTKIFKKKEVVYDDKNSDHLPDSDHDDLINFEDKEERKKKNEEQELPNIELAPPPKED